MVWSWYYKRERRVPLPHSHPHPSQSETPVQGSGKTRRRVCYRYLPAANMVSSGDSVPPNSRHYDLQHSLAPLRIRKNRLPGTPDPDAEVVALSPKSLTATHRYFCDSCERGFQRLQNLQLHRRGHNLPWKLPRRGTRVVRRKVYVCPEEKCAHHHPSRALGDLTGIKKHFWRKHGERTLKCDLCDRMYAVMSDLKAHLKVCGTREYMCHCGDRFKRKDKYVAHKAYCIELVAEAAASASSSGTAADVPNLNADAGLENGDDLAGVHLNAPYAAEEVQGDQMPLNSASSDVAASDVNVNTLAAEAPASGFGTGCGGYFSSLLAADHSLTASEYHALLGKEELSQSLNAPMTPFSAAEVSAAMALMMTNNAAAAVQQCASASNNPSPSLSFSGGGIAFSPSIFQIMLQATQDNMLDLNMNMNMNMDSSISSNNSYTGEEAAAVLNAANAMGGAAMMSIDPNLMVGSGPSEAAGQSAPLNLNLSINPWYGYGLTTPSQTMDFTGNGEEGCGTSGGRNVLKMSTAGFQGMDMGASPSSA